MKKTILILMIFCTVLASAAVDRYYVLDIYYNNATFELKDLNVVKDAKYSPDNSGILNLQIISINDEVIHEEPYDFSLVRYYDEVDPTTGLITGGGQDIIDQGEFSIVLPYFENTKEIKLTYRNSILISIDVDKLSKIDQSPPEETSTLPPSEEIDIKTSSTFLWWIVIVILLAIAAYIYWKRKKRPQFGK